MPHHRFADALGWYGLIKIVKLAHHVQKKWRDVNQPVDAIEHAAVAGNRRAHVFDARGQRLRAVKMLSYLGRHQPRRLYPHSTMARRTLSGSRVLITGASSGIGRALAVELARGGARLVLNGRRQDRLQAAADDVRAAGGQVMLAVGDVTRADQRAEALAAAQRHFGGLDLLVNNAGVSAWGRFDSASPERLRQIMEVNFFALAEMTRAALPLLADGRDPLVVNIASILGHRGIPLQSEYCASKFAVRGFSEALRAELAKQRIDVLVVCPGSTESEFFEHLIEKTGEMPWPAQPKTPAAVVARQIVRAIERGRHEIVPSRRGQLLVWLNRLAPRLVDRWMERYG